MTDVQRRRRLLTAGTVALIAGVCGGTSAAASPGKVVPDQPVALAVSRGGALYIADRGRNEILERIPSGRFRVVAGAVAGPASLVIVRDGTLYFTQTGTYRGAIGSSGGMLNTVIREITRTGTIRTVAGLRPRCPPGRVDSISAESALFYGARLSLTPSGALAVDAGVCAGGRHGAGVGPNLRLTSSGRFVEDRSNPVPAVASVDCGSGVPGPGFHVFACMSGGARAGHAHPKELVVVRSDGTSVAYPGFRVGEFAVGDGEVVATYDVNLVRVTSSRLVPLLTAGELARALRIRPTGIADVYAPTVDRHGDIYFVASMLSRSGCQNRILERTAGGTIDQIWASATLRNNTCG